MERYDRLTTLIDRFKLTVAPATPSMANLAVFASAHGTTPDRALFCAEGADFTVFEGNLIFCARVDWSGTHNPLLTALPDTVAMDLSADPDCMGLVRMMAREIDGRRCGGESVLGRLGEVLIVRMIRAQIEAGRNEELAQLSGMSLSRFSEMFLAEVGQTPAAYLRHWRLTLSRQDLAKGQRVDVVARRYGFASTEGFTRAFKKYYGNTPSSLRQRKGVAA